MSNMTPQYFLENRYQDSGWERLEGPGENSLEGAVTRAEWLSRDGIQYGMVRVVNAAGVVCVVFSAGHEPFAARDLQPFYDGLDSYATPVAEGVTTLATAPNFVLEKRRPALTAGWETMPNEGFNCLASAIMRAERLSRSALVAHADIRVVDMFSYLPGGQPIAEYTRTVVEFKAGHRPVYGPILFSSTKVEASLDVPVAANRAARGIRIRNPKKESDKR